MGPTPQEISSVYDVSYVIPGSVVACSEIDSLLLSTFECFYSDSVCYPTLRSYLGQAYMWNTNFSLQLPTVFGKKPIWLNAKPLVYNSTLTRFYRNSSISTITKNLLIEQWNPTYSYNGFYQLCSPSYCIYQQRIHMNNVIEIVVILMSMIGGLIISIHFIAPYLVMFIIKLISVIMRKQQRQQQHRHDQGRKRRWLVQQY